MRRRPAKPIMPIDIHTTGCTLLGATTTLTAAAPTAVWDLLLETLILLAAAMVLGVLAESLRQSAVVGYLIAGTLVGPGALGWVGDQDSIYGIAELGVALLLFTIGLEFSLPQLIQLGRVPLISGPLQVLLTVVLGAGLACLVGLPPGESVVVGSMMALSSTACVVRVLRDRAELDSQFGRTALGVLLIQDAAVVPLVFIVTALSSGGSLHQIAGRMLFLVGLAAALIGVFYLLFSQMMPRVLVMSTWRRNRDLPVLLTVCMAGGAAWSAHALQLSPALGAFLAGVLLAVSPYATQIQADVQPLRSVLVTLFIAAIGMFGDVDWFVQHIGIVAVALVAIVGLKLLIVTVLTWAARLPLQFAVATGCCLAQIGEFSFVLAMIVRGDAAERSVMSEPVFQAMVSATLLSLFATPYLIAAGPRWGSRLERELRRYGAWTRAAETPAATAGLTAAAAAAAAPADVILILGFGPAGQRVAEELLAAHRDRLVVVDLNIDNIAVAHRYGILAHVGDATQTDILERASTVLTSS